MALFQPAYSVTQQFLQGYTPDLLGLGASFLPAYQTYIQPSEGGYVNDGADKGGETYAGIARNFNPSWGGWDYIDFVKRTKGAISRNTKFKDIQYLVDAFYKERWDKNRFGQINSQDVANLLFDFHVHSQAIAIKTIQQLVEVPADGAMGTQTIAAINGANAAKLHDKLKKARESFLKNLVAKDPSQQKFLEGWLNRISKFPTLLKNNMNTVWLIAGGVIVTGSILYLFSIQDKPKTV